MSISLAIAILAVFATLAVAFLQPVVTNWLAPKQKLRVDVIASEFAIPPTISREMANFGIELYVQGKPKPEFGEFLRNADRYETYFDVTVTNNGKLPHETRCLDALPTASTS